MARASGRWRLVIGAVVTVVAAAVVAWYLSLDRTAFETHGPVVSNEGSDYEGNDALVGGRLEWDGNCLLLSGSAVIWPRGTRWDADRSVLELPGGAEAELGDTVTGGGGAFGGRGDQGWHRSEAGRAISPCQARGTEVTVFNRSDEPTVEP